MFPRHSLFELTYRCNYRCRFCFCADNVSARELSVDEWIRIVREMRRYGGAREITLSGGEPLLHSELGLLLKGLKDEGVAFRNVFTNGSLLDAEKIELLSQFATGVHLSLSGRSRYTELTGSKCGYESILNKLDSCVQKGLFVVVSSVLTSENFEEMDALADDCFRAGASGIQFGYVMCEGAVEQNLGLLLNWRQKVEIHRRLEAVRKRYPQKCIMFSNEVKCRCRNRVSRFVSRLCGYRCIMGRQIVVVSPDGYLRPCVHESNRRPIAMFSEEQRNMFFMAMSGGNLW